MESAKLKQVLARDDLTLEELVDISSTLLDAVAPNQTRYRVNARPDARTIRYYITQGLLPRANGYVAGRAQYTGRHVLRLLMIKKMQAAHHTLRRIGSVLSAASDEDVLAELGLSKQPTPIKPAAAIERLELAPDSVVEVPEHVLRNVDERRQLARNLVALARWLELTGAERNSDS
jgi:DNA-binding transcriptional MerR regulator